MSRTGPEATAKEIVKRYLDDYINDHQLETQIAEAITSAQTRGAEHPFGPCGYRYCDWPDGELRCNEPRANPASALNLLTALEHEMQRNHEFSPAGCSECGMSETIANKLRE